MILARQHGTKSEEEEKQLIVSLGFQPDFAIWYIKDGIRKLENPIDVCHESHKCVLFSNLSIFFHKIGNPVDSMYYIWLIVHFLKTKRKPYFYGSFEKFL